ncbi:MAG: methyltransferase domain-containing protein [Planctomycetota bacterium]
MPLTDKVASAFSQEQYANPYPDGIQHHYWTVARHRIIRRNIAALVSQDRQTILDVGCGRGITVDYLRGQMLNAIGCEIANPTPIAESVVPYLYLNQDAFQLPGSIREDCGLLLILDVLEHLSSPDDFLSRCYEAFPAAAYIFVTVPARMELWSNYDDYYEHFVRYDQATLRSICSPALYDVNRIEYFFHSLYAPALALKYLGRDRSVKINPPAPWARPIHRLIATAFDFEQIVVPGKVIGTSLLCILKRRRQRQ